MKIGIVDYGVGNIGSVQNMLRKVGAECESVSAPSKLEDYAALVLPGVGAFDSGMSRLSDLGLDSALKHYAKQDKSYLLGICLGMQLLMSSSEEGDLPGLGLISGIVKRFDFSSVIDGASLKIPHMGWNEVRPKSGTPLFEGLEDQSRFYFVHSYHAVCESNDDVLATAKYGYEFACSIGKGKVFGAQFHPEKSHRFGLAMFRNFINIVGAHAS